MKYLLYKALVRAGRMVIGFDNVGALGRALAWVFRLAVPSRYKLAAKAIEERLDKPRQEAERLAAASLAENFTSFLEILLTPAMDESFLDERLEYNDKQLFDQFREPRRPVIFATAHMGSWELLSGALGLTSRAANKQVVVRKAKDEALHRIMTELRGGKGVEIIEHRRAVFKLLKSLKRGGVAAFLVDHNCSQDEAVFLPFLGKTAAVNAGPALLAVRTEALIVPVFLVRLGHGKYRMIMEPPLDTVNLEGERGERIAQAAEFYTKAVERCVQAYPEQWFWMHKRWKTRPPEEEAGN